VGQAAPVGSWFCGPVNVAYALHFATSLQTREVTMATTKPSEKPSEPAFLSGAFQLAPPRELKITAKEFSLNRESAQIFTFDQQIAAVTKTMGPFRGEIRLASGEVIATLDDVRVTVTRMTGQQGQSFLMYSLEYFVTAHGWRTGDFRTYFPSPGTVAHEPYGAPHQILFQNSAGGTMHSWSIDPPFLSECGDNHRPRLFHKAEYYALGWFDAWATVTHYVNGPFFRC
jgi:hypothetical protein